MKMNRALKAVGMLGAAHFVGLCKANAADLIRFQTAKVYLKSAEFLRDFFLHQIGVLIGAFFLALGIVLMQIAVIFYFPLDLKARASFAFGIGLFDFLIAIGFLYFFSSTQAWLKFAAKHNECVGELLETESGRQRNKRVRHASLSE